MVIIYKFINISKAPPSAFLESIPFYPNPLEEQ